MVTKQLPPIGEEKLTDSLSEEELRQARLQIRQGIIQILGGLEKLWGLPRSIEPKHKR